MSLSPDQTQKVVPAQLGFLAIYNPSLGTTDETVQNQIVYYSSSEARYRAAQKAPTKPTDAALREENNEQLRQIGLAQGMVEFGRSFSDGRAVDTVETEKSRIVLHELEAGWWILASINLTVLPISSKSSSGKGRVDDHQEATEYSSREVKPAILLLGDLLRAHSTFLLHHASSMSALFVRTRRSKFVGILGRYWDTFLSTWNVLMHGNPANSLYGGIKVAACGELGVGVGEEERGSGEREVLEGFVGRIEGLVDVIVSRFGDVESGLDPGTESEKREVPHARPASPWLGSGNEPGAEDGVIFLGTGAVSRKSLRDVSHWVEDLYRWGPYAYGVMDNPTSTRRPKKPKHKEHANRKELSPDTRKKSKQVYGLAIRDTSSQNENPSESPMAAIPPTPMRDGHSPNSPKTKRSRPSFHRGPSSFTSTDSESSKANKFVSYLKLGYGTHWTLGGTSLKNEGVDTPSAVSIPEAITGSHGKPLPGTDLGGASESSVTRHDSSGHYMIGLMGDIENEDGEASEAESQSPKDHANLEENNTRLVLRTLTVELEREEDARAETEISIDLGQNEQRPSSSKLTGSEHTGTSNASFESQDRNKTKKLRVIVYANRPFIFVFLFELRTDALALTSLYRSLHYQIGPLHKPLLNSTTYRASKPDVATTDGSTTPIYDLIWDPRLLTINSTIPNIPDPLQLHFQSLGVLPWSRIEALNTHMQIINTYIASSTDRSELERTCKTSRGWWVVWTRIPDPEPSAASLASGQVKIPGLIAEDGAETSTSNQGGRAGTGASRGTSTFMSTTSAAHPFLEAVSNGYEVVSKDKEIFLIRRASDYVASKSAGRAASGSATVSEVGWTSSGPGKLAQGIGVDTKRYIEGLLNLNR
ncbi:hypothetical protein L207DRAFT_422107 [Hyaloscypha variabilis F]|uniref:CCZ1/INTU/HSP4 first Longin domain-containing protein n=1 Tax=Hyaloscypha variabilis (strain UAMH 11265 / GT02V1 / F) TaxID=1149755 RepID=A0A2J6S0I6_HYAVF|nr:hypothetical protein L207DRAFT_422107 [Hyaloscypha variabilis F]